MSLLNPFFLVGALALAIPVLIHLVRKEKSEIVPFSSLMFLLKVPKAAIRQQKMKNLLLMALRLLLLALLVGAFARPYFTADPSQAAGTGENRGIVLMLDNSYSMQYGTNFERLKNEAVQRIDDMTPADRMAIIAFNDIATILSMPSSDKNILKAAVDTLEPSFGATKFYEAFTLADRAFTQMQGNQKQLYIISDFQRNGWNRSSRESILGADVKAEFVNLGIQNPINVGIDSVNVEQQTSFTRIYGSRVIARIHNHRKDQAVNVPVIVRINDREAARKTLNVPVNSTALAEFSGFELPLGYSKGSIKVESDDPLQVDNEFLFTLDRRDKLKVLIMDSGRQGQSLYLRQAYESSPEVPFEVRVATAQSINAQELGNHQVVVVNDVARLTDAQRDKFDELRKAGQGQLIILGDYADIGWWNSYAKLPVRLERKIFVARDRGQPSVSLTTYDKNHNIFKPFERSSRVGLNTAQFNAYVEVQPKEGALVLAKFENGAVAIAESSQADRGLLVFTSTVDHRWNDLPLKPSFLPVFYEMIQYLSRYSELRGWYALGEGIPIQGGIESSNAAVIDPKGARHALGDLGAGSQTFFSPRLAGFHEIRVGPDSRLTAVNPPSSEGNLETMPPEDLLASVQRTQGETQQAGFFTDDEHEALARRQTGWWYLLLFALLAGIAEIYIANRSYGRT